MLVSIECGQILVIISTQNQFIPIINELLT